MLPLLAELEAIDARERFALRGKDEIPLVPWESKGLTAEQAVTAQEVFEWVMKGPGFARPGQSFREGSMAVMEGVAGSGKTHSLSVVIDQLKVFCPELVPGLDDEPAEVIGVAPTGQAVKVLMSASGSSFTQCSTLASLLGLRPKVVEMSQSELDRLNQLKGATELSQEEEVEQKVLEMRYRAALEEVVQFLPQNKTATRKRVERTRLLVVDECSLVDGPTLGFLFELILSGVFPPSLQILFVGDREQLPPVGEVLSKVFDLPGFTRLKKVERYSGLLLDLANEAIVSPRLEDLVPIYCNKAQKLPKHLLPTVDGEPFVPIEVMRRTDAIAAMTELCLAGEDCRWVSATRKEVREVNEAIQRAKLGGHYSYVPGDKLLCLSPASIDKERGTRRAVGKNAKMLVPNSEIVEVLAVWPADPVESHGKKFHLCEAEVRFDGARLDEPLVLVEPSQMEEWIEECDRLRARAEAVNREPSVKSRCKSATKQDLLVFDIWDEIGAASWEGVNRDRLRKRLWWEYYKLLRCCDDVSLSWASTVHKTQGCGFSTVFFSYGSLFPSRKPNYGKGTDWDIRKIFYTAITRTRNQLIGVA